jgi:hypothetical protein
MSDERYLRVHTQSHVVAEVQFGAEIVAIADPEKRSNVANAARVGI